MVVASHGCGQPWLWLAMVVVLHPHIAMVVASHGCGIASPHIVNKLAENKTPTLLCPDPSNFLRGVAMSWNLHELSFRSRITWYVTFPMLILTASAFSGWYVVA